MLLWLLLQADPAGLVDRLSYDDPEIRLEAELRLIETGPPARKPVERLLASQDSELRLRAERILQYLDWGITVEGRKRVDALLVSSRVPPDRDALEWPDPWDIIADEEAWKALGPSVAPYLMQLRSASKHPERRRKLLNLASLGGGKEALPAALEALGSTDVKDLWCGITACARIGDPSALGPLARLLRDETVLLQVRRGPEISVAHEAAAAIEAISGLPLDAEVWVESFFPFVSRDGLSRPEAVGAWWDAVKGDPRPEAWHAAARREGVARIDPKRPPAERLQGCLLLLAVGGEDDRLCDTLIDLCRAEPEDSGSFRLRTKAVHFLLSARAPKHFRGRPAERIEARLEAVLSDPARRGSWTAALGLAWDLLTEDNPNLVPPGKLHPLGRLRRLLPDVVRSEEPLHRYLAAMTLAFMGERGVESPILEALRLALEPCAADSGWLRSAALWTASRWEEADTFEHVPIEALKRVASDGARGLLRTCVREADPYRRSTAALALLELGDGDTALPVVRELLLLEKDPVWRDRSYLSDHLRETAFKGLYGVRREEALAWARKELATPRERGFLQDALGCFLVERSEPLGIEYWAGRKGKVYSTVFAQILRMEPGVLVPVLLDLVEKGNPGARELLTEWADDPQVGRMSASRLRAWWETRRDR